MKAREEAKRLIYAIRRMGGRIWLEERDGSPWVLVECGSVPIPPDMLAKAKAMKPALVAELSDVRDPEYRARRAFIAVLGIARYNSLAIKLAGIRQRLHWGEQ